MTTHESVVICPKCGGAISAGDLFCTHCGAKQAPVERKAAAVEGNWFSRPGSLPVSVRNPAPPAPPVSYETMPVEELLLDEEPTRDLPVAEPPVREITVEELPEEKPAVEPAPFMKPVKPRTAAPVRREAESAAPVHREAERVAPVRREAVPVAPVYREKERVEPVRYRPESYEDIPHRSAVVASKAPVEKPEFYEDIPHRSAVVASMPARKRDAEKAAPGEVRRSDPRRRSGGKRKIAIAAISLVLVLAVVALALLLFRGDAVTEDRIREDLPREVTTLQIGDEQIPMTLDGLTIDRRQTQDGVDDVYCILELSSEEYALTRYEQLTYIETKDGWVLDGYAPYDPDELRILEPSAQCRDWAIERIQADDGSYADLDSCITDYEARTDSRKVSYVFHIQKSQGVMDLVGQITIDCVPEQLEDQRWNWSGSPDDSGVQRAWNVTGVWTGEAYEGKDGRCALSLELETLSVEQILCTWTYEQAGTVSNGDGADCWLIEHGEDHITIGIGYGATLADYIRVTFYSDGTCMAEIPDQDQFALVQQ